MDVFVNRLQKQHKFSKYLNLNKMNYSVIDYVCNKNIINLFISKFIKERLKLTSL